MELIGIAISGNVEKKLSLRRHSVNGGNAHPREAARERQPHLGVQTKVGYALKRMVDLGESKREERLVMRLNCLNID
jgi:hypothetical protein